MNMLHVDIKESHVNIFISHVDIIYLAYWEQMHATIDWLPNATMNIINQISPWVLHKGTRARYVHLEKTFWFSDRSTIRKVSCTTLQS